MNTDSFIMYKKTEDIYSDTSKDVETRFHTSNYELDRPLPKRNNKKVIGLMKDRLGRQLMTEFAALRPKTFSYLTDDSDENKKQKARKSVS